MSEEIKGYSYGQEGVAKAPFTEEDLQKLKETLLWTEEDDRYLQLAGEVLKDQVDAVLDLWYGYVGSHSHLVYYFQNLETGEPDSHYLESVRRRFGQWILDLCFKPKDQTWLDYQYEIGLRHYKTKKNQTDQVQAPPFVHYRYMIAFIYPITVTIKPFLAKKGHSTEEVEKMYQAWFKAVVLSVIFWTYPYVHPEEF